MPASALQLAGMRAAQKSRPLSRPRDTRSKRRVGGEARHSGTVTLTASSFSSKGTSPAGTTTTMSGTGAAAGYVPGILVITTATSGNFFADNAGELGVVVAARGNAVAPGFMAIGRKQ